MMTKKQTSLDDIADAISDLATFMGEKFQQVDQRFETLEGEMNGMHQEMNGMHQEMNGMRQEIRGISQEQREMRQWLERIDSRLMGVESDIKEIYDRLLVLEQIPPGKHTAEQLTELEQKLVIMIRWAKAVSRKTGIALPKI